MAEGDGDKIRKEGDRELNLEVKCDTNRTGSFPWFNIEHKVSLQEVESRNGRARKSPLPPPQWQNLPPGSSRVRRSEQMLVEQTGPEHRRGDLGGWRRGRKSPRYSSGRGAHRHVLVLKLLGAESFVDSSCFGWLCPIMAKSMGPGACLPGLNLSSYTYSVFPFWKFIPYASVSYRKINGSQYLCHTLVMRIR